MNPSMLEEDEHFLISLERNAEVISKRFSLEPHELDSSTVRDDEVSFHSSGEAKDESSFEALQQKHFEEQKTENHLEITTEERNSIPSSQNREGDSNGEDTISPHRDSPSKNILNQSPHKPVEKFTQFDRLLKNHIDNNIDPSETEEELMSYIQSIIQKQISAKQNHPQKQNPHHAQERDYIPEKGNVAKLQKCIRSHHHQSRGQLVESNITEEENQEKPHTLSLKDEDDRFQPHKEIMYRVGLTHDTLQSKSQNISEPTVEKGPMENETLSQSSSIFQSVLEVAATEDTKTTAHMPGTPSKIHSPTLKQLSRSPTSSGVSQSSKTILRNVLNTSIEELESELSESPPQSAQIYQSHQPSSRGHSFIPLSPQFNLRSPTNITSGVSGNEGQSLHGTPVHVPRPSSEKPSEKLIYYIKHLTNKNYLVRFDAIKSIHTLISTEKQLLLDSLCSVLVDELVKILGTYQIQGSTFIGLVIETLRATKDFAQSSIPYLTNMLHDPDQYMHYESIIATLFSIGRLGFEALIEIASEASSERDSFILTHISSHPLVQETVVVPALVRECHSSDMKHRQNAVKALIRLGSRAKGALSMLTELFINGQIDRRETALAIRSCGEEGERLLIFLLSQNPNPRVRMCAASALGMGNDGQQHLNLNVVISADLTTTYAAPPKIFFHFPDDTNATVFEEYIILDARETITNIQQCMTGGLFDNIGNTSLAINPKLTGLFLRILEKNRLNNITRTSFSKCKGLSNMDAHIDKSLEQLKNSIHADSFSSSYQTLDNFSIDEPDESQLNMNGGQSDVSELFSTRQYNHQMMRTSFIHSEISTVKEETVHALSMALFDSDDSVRIAAIRSLGNISSPIIQTAILPLCKTLDDVSNRVRAEALNTLSKVVPQLGDRNDTFKNLALKISGMMQDQFWNVRFSACKALRSFGPILGVVDTKLAKALLHTLIKTLKDGSVSRHDVAESIMTFGEQGAFVLMKFLRQEAQHNPQMRISCAHGLQFTPIRPPLIDRVVECLFASSRDRIPLVRRAVLLSLGVLAIRAEGAHAYLRARSFLPFVYAFLKDREKCVREAAGEVLANHGPHGELLLIEGLLKDSNAVIRASAAYGLKLIGAKTIRTLLLALHDKDNNVVKSVVSAIDSIGVPAIVSVLEHRPRHHRDSVIQSTKEVLASPFPGSKPLKDLLLQLQDELRNR